jgi:hypothetical protein
MTEKRDDREAPDGEEIPEDESDVDQQFDALFPHAKDDDRDETLPPPP